MQAVAAGIVGVGYQGRTAAEVIRGLRQDGVTTVVDVRLTPISRKPGLSKTALREGLEEAEIDYLHLRALGNPKSNRAGFTGGVSDKRSAIATYRASLDNDAARQALESLRQRMAHERVALLCFEAEEPSCHRQVIMDLIREGSGPER